MHCSYPRCPCKATGIYCSSKPAAKSKARKAIPKRSEKGKIKALNKKHIIQNDMLMYLEIWEERAHVCFETNDIIQKPLIQNFHHVLEKGSFPEYHNSKWNIVILHADVHSQVHSNIDKTPKVKELRERLINLHQQIKLKP